MPAFVLPGARRTLKPRAFARPAPQASAAPRQAAPRQAAPIAKASSTAFYNPARIIDRSQLKIVDSIAAERQKDFAEERGDAVAPINGGGTAAPRKYILDAPEQADKPDMAKLIIPAILAYFIFGG